MAVKKAEVGSGQGAGSRDVVVLLTEILDEFRKQVQSKTPPGLGSKAVLAVEQFREIDAALTLQRRPIITLVNDPPQGDRVILRWSSTGAQKVLLHQDVGGRTTDLGELTPATGGSREFFGAERTTFTATAQGPCSVTASVIVEFSP